ncbi:hypothetical protein K490DRAFT_71723 [Saccharata proteae CBS 121410]|uniref:Major facilitator superfamily transporter n=1 Tax=Saccharata proteae CBS 121410 TaxID=1314787 RepID=A0A9P4HZN2_9PEZI|nr:hypothetical protein K490DRAFT_71723 [Saccharata proteae CBS 121410]
MNPMKLLPIKTGFNYEQLPGYETNGTPSGFTTPLKKYRWRSPSPGGDRFSLPKMTFSRAILFAITLIFCIGLMATGGYRRHQHMLNLPPPPRELFPWEHFPRLNGYYNGIRTLVSMKDYVPEQAYIRPDSEESLDTFPSTTQKVKSHQGPEPSPSVPPMAYNPYPDFDSYQYRQQYEPVETCYLDDGLKTESPDVYAYPGISQNMTAPFFGSYDQLGIPNDVCWERFGRLSSYGYGYDPSEGGYLLADNSENVGAERVWEMVDEKRVNWNNVDWGRAQQSCYEKNKIRFHKDAVTKDGRVSDPNKKRVKRTAYILRTWTGYFYSDWQTLSLRAMINELSLKSGGEYDVHLLVHVKDDSIPIWASDVIYQKTLEENVPKEFWGIATLWSEQQMRTYYPEPFTDNLENDSGLPVHSVYRGAHFALQWFSQEHPEYDFYWNWEMDLRYTGHYYEFHDRIGQWAKKQPRKGLWERSSKFYMPDVHGSWENFTKMTEEEIQLSEEAPVWGPPSYEARDKLKSPPGTTPPTSYMKDNYEWGVGEDADLITFNPFFDPEKTNWVFRHDITGYDLSLPPPPRRVAIITVARLSKRLLDLMHEETYKMRHTMFPEMWPPTVAYHHGLKAAYAPHPVYFDRNWDLDYMNQIFNYPKKDIDSPFGWGEHNLLGSSFYYNSGFSGALWRRWLGADENGEGGRLEEENGSGRMCLRGILFHPIKFERGQ